MARYDNEEPDDELDYDDEELDDEPSDEDAFDDELDDEGDRRDIRPPRRAEDLAAQLSTITAERDDLKKRLGSALEVGGKKLKDYETEVQQWAANVQSWHDTELQRERSEAFAEGARTVEKRLLPLLDSEEKSDYLTEARISPQEISPRPPVKLDPRGLRPSEDARDLTDAVQKFIAMGVPLDQLDQSSVSAVVESGAKAMQGRIDSIEEKLASFESRFERKSRDDSGATRVSRGGGGSSRAPRMSQLQEQLEELRGKIKVAKASHNINLGTRLLQEEKDLLAQMAQEQKRQRVRG